MRSKLEKSLITQQRLKEVLNYNPNTGSFTWVINKGKCKAGEIAGCIGDGDYRYIGIDGFSIRASHLAFLYMQNKLPKFVDHINRVRSDNSWRNLQESSYELNSKNKSTQSNNTSGYPGVAYDKSRNKWEAAIKINYAKKHLGRFSTLEEAITARKNAEVKYGFSLIRN